MWFDLLPPLIYCMAGWLGGYMVCRRGFHDPVDDGLHKSSSPVAHQIDREAISTVAAQQWESQTAREAEIVEATERLRLFARTLAQDVDAHQSEVQAVNNSLHETTDSQREEAICEAVNRLIEANETMQQQLQSAQDQIQSQACQLESAERKANTDALTRVGNRRAFDEHLAKRFAQGPGQAGTLALLDIDNFKQFNDTHGHRTGDEVLRVVAGLISSRLESLGIVARYGGEEFAIVLDGYRLADSLTIVEVARQAIGSREIQFENKRLRVTASVGMAELGHDETADDWLQRADDCLYHSKKMGRDCAHWSERGIYHRVGEETSKSDSLDSESASDSGDMIIEVMPASKPEASRVRPAGEAATGAGASPASHPFPYLPEREDLIVAVRELASHLRTSRMPMSVMAIQIGTLIHGPASRSLLQIVRAASRSIDRIGCDGPTTLIICMPNADVPASLERASQIYRSAESLTLKTRDASQLNLLGIGITPWDGGDDFQLAFDVAEQLARAAVSESIDAIRTSQSQAALVSSESTSAD